jgi:hypothetical protein
MLPIPGRCPMQEYTATAGFDFVVPIGNLRLSLVACLDASMTGETWFSAVQEESVVTEFGVPGGVRRHVLARSTGPAIGLDLKYSSGQ